MSNALTHEYLASILSYDASTGIFTWRVGRRGTRAGTQAGSVAPLGYIKIRIDKIAYGAHRLAILYATGDWPTMDVDHIDGDKGNNVIANLRHVTHRVNQQNRRAPNRRATGRSSKYLGVSWKKNRSKWAANIQGDNGKARFIGYFGTEIEAHNAYLDEKRRTHEGNTL